MNHIIHITRHKVRIIIVVVGVVFAVFFVTASVFAAELRIDSKQQELAVGDQFEVSFFLNAEGEDVNAVEGNIIFSENLLGIKEIRDGNSIINFWVERPKTTPGSSVYFAGIIPGGYIENKGFIFSIVFEAKSEGSGVIDIGGVKVLRNDGKGTEARVSVFQLPFTIFPFKEGDTPSVVESFIDEDPPESFELLIAQTPELFEGKYFLVFATQDKGSGILHYKVREGRGDFVIAKSPYLLENQNLDKKIIVKAIDKNGNERIAFLPPQNPKPWYKNYLILAIILVLGAASFYILIEKRVWRKIYKK